MIRLSHLENRNFESALEYARQEAAEKAAAVKQRQFATRLIHQTNLSDQQIAELSDLEVSRIESLRTELKGV